MAALGNGYHLQVLSWSQSQQYLTYKLLEHPSVGDGRRVRGGRSTKQQWRHSGESEPVTPAHLPDIPTYPNETNKSALEKLHKEMRQGHRVSDGTCTRSGLWQPARLGKTPEQHFLLTFSTYLPSSTLAHETEGLRSSILLWMMYTMLQWVLCCPHFLCISARSLFCSCPRARGCPTGAVLMEQLLQLSYP